MQVRIVTPSFLPATRGNAVTVQRLLAGLTATGVDVEVRDPEGRILVPSPARGPLELVHGFHAFHAGPAALEAAAREGVPACITLTGTDFNEDPAQPSRLAVLERVIREAAALVVFTQSSSRAVQSRFPEALPRLRVIPQAPHVEGWTRPPGVAAAHGALTLLHLAGIRPVKANLFSLAPVKRLRQRFPSLRLVFAGPVLDRAYAEALLAAIRDRPWASYAGEVPRAELPLRLAAAEVVLNTSVSEGGMPNALLEAMWWGVPVLANDVAGNRELFEDGVSGLLYRGERGFVEQLTRLLTEPDLGPGLAAAARARVDQHFTPRLEAERHVALYRELVTARRAPPRCG